jgi:hypothetical protein
MYHFWCNNANVAKFYFCVISETVFNMQLGTPYSNCRNLSYTNLPSWHEHRIMKIRISLFYNLSLHVFLHMKRNNSSGMSRYHLLVINKNKIEVYSPLTWQMPKEVFFFFWLFPKVVDMKDASFLRRQGWLVKLKEWNIILPKKWLM